MGQFSPEWDLTTKEVAGIEPAQHEIGVRDCCIHPAVAVTGRARRRAGALRPDAQHSARVDPRNRAASRADLHQVYYGRPDRVPASAPAPGVDRRLRANLVVFGYPRRAVLNQRGLGSGAAHVQRQHVPVADGFADVRGRYHTRGRARLHHVHGALDCSLEVVHAAVALHHQQLGLEAVCAQPLFDGVQVAANDRRDRGVDYRGTGPEILPELGNDVG